MPIFAAAALPFTMGAIGAGATATGAAIGAQKASNAAKYGADLQSQAAEKALAFQKEEAAKSQANFEATQRANYNQWAAREGRLSQLGQLVGLPARTIPDYVPTTAGALVNGQPAGSPAGSPMGPPPGGPPRPPMVANAGLLMPPPPNLVRTPQLGPYQTTAGNIL